MKKAFSLFELIFVLVIVSVVSTIAYNKFFNTIDSANLTKVKAEVALINSAINRLQSNQIMLSNEDFYFEKLDNANIDTKGETLFNGFEEYVLLDTLIISTSSEEKKIGSWIKLSNTKYEIFLNETQSLTFQFDIDDLKFSCDETKDLCKEIYL